MWSRKKYPVGAFIFIIILVCFAFFRLVGSQLWYFTYSMGYSGLIIRLITSGGLLLLFFLIAVYVWKSGNKKVYGKDVQTQTIITSDGQYQQNTVYKKKSLSDASDPKVSKLVLYILVAVISWSFMSIWMEVIPSIQDLNEQPVTGVYRCEIYYNTRVSRYTIIAYDEDDVVVNRFYLSKFEELVDKNNDSIFNPPFFFGSNAAKQYRMTITYYPYSETRVSIENIEEIE